MKYQFASDQWLAAVHGMMAYCAKAQVAQCPGFKISICEVYLDVPEGRGCKDGRLAWSCVSEGDHVVFELCERDDVDLKYEVDFATALDLGRLGSSEVRQRFDAAISEGKMVVTRREGTHQGNSDPFIHDLMVGITA